MPSVPNLSSIAPQAIAYLRHSLPPRNTQIHAAEANMQELLLASKSLLATLSCNSQNTPPLWQYLRRHQPQTTRDLIPAAMKPQTFDLPTWQTLLPQTQYLELLRIIQSVSPEQTPSHVIGYLVTSSHTLPSDKLSSFLESAISDKRITHDLADILTAMRNSLLGMRISRDVPPAWFSEKLKNALLGHLKTPDLSEKACDILALAQADTSRDLVHFTHAAQTLLQGRYADPALKLLRAMPSHYQWDETIKHNLATLIREATTEHEVAQLKYLYVGLYDQIQQNGGTPYADILEALLTHNDPVLRKCGLDSLKAAPRVPQPLIETVLTLIEDPNSSVRDALRQGLSKWLKTP